jgi:hypothetical protein
MREAEYLVFHVKKGAKFARKRARLLTTPKLLLFEHSPVHDKSGAGHRLESQTKKNIVRLSSGPCSTHTHTLTPSSKIPDEESIVQHTAKGRKGGSVGASLQNQPI